MDRRTATRAATVIYRNIYAAGPDRALGTAARRAHRSATRRASRTGSISSRCATTTRSCRSTPTASNMAPTPPLPVDVTRVITAGTRRRREDWCAEGTKLADGDEVRLALHPFGTDYLGRDLLARLMYGARVSLFIGIVAPFFFVLLGDSLRQHRGLSRRHASIRCSCASPISCRAAVPAVHDPVQDRVRHRSRRERHLADARRARGAQSGPAPRGSCAARSCRSARRRYIGASRLLGAQTRLSDPAAHDSEHARRHSRDAHVRGAERDLHRSVPVVHRHGRRAADAVVGQHVQRRHRRRCSRIRTS